METKTISARILACILLKMGERDVYLASDEEGNSFGTITGTECIEVHKDKIILYPAEQDVDIERP